jgi:hypothetical protein
MSILRFPPPPRYDAQQDGNPFAWIVATAPKVRAQRQVLAENEALRVAIEKRKARRLLQAVEE